MLELVLLAVTAIGAAKTTAAILGSIIGIILAIVALFALWVAICEKFFEGLASLIVFYYGILAVIIGSVIFGIIWAIIMIVGN